MYDKAVFRRQIISQMNKNYERCNRCTHCKLLKPGCLRKFLKPMECKHLQRTLDSKRDFNDTDRVNCVLLAERKPPGNSGKFIKFWKSKLFITSSVRSLQRYFTNKAVGNGLMRNLNKSNDPSTSSSKQNSAVSMPDQKKNSAAVHKANALKCNHSTGQLILRGHDKHPSDEDCDIYCQLSRHGWYWGGITSSEAEELLAGQHDNVFLVRDSYSSRHLLCVSFRCVGRTLHARLRHANGLFSLNNETFVPANRISEHCATVDVASYMFQHPVRLARPLNRFAKLDSLQMICRFVIRQSISSGAFHELPLPPNLIAYVSLGSDYISPHS